MASICGVHDVDELVFQLIDYHRQDRVFGFGFFSEALCLGEFLNKLLKLFDSWFHGGAPLFDEPIPAQFIVLKWGLQTKGR